MSNAQSLHTELTWLRDVLERRLRLHFGHENAVPDILGQPPIHDAETGFYGHFTHHYELDPAERIVLMLALAPHVQPRLLDIFLIKNPDTGRRYSEFGGAEEPGPFLPTIETALFVLAGDDLEQRFLFQQIFDADYVLREHRMLIIDRPRPDGPFGEGRLSLPPEIRALMTSGLQIRPDFGPDFPARRISTPMDWQDLVLDPFTLESLEEIKAWYAHGPRLLNDPILGKQLKPGYRVLFHGPPGVGKTLSAMLLGKHAERDVYRIDLSLIISKYIGETEKNLEKVFHHAENKDWILFFDEADALFGKRTEVQSSHDRFANQEVSYLLQRVEDFPGLVILATNFRNNLDSAFVRRFQAIIRFPMPAEEQRYTLWQQTFSQDLPHPEDQRLREVANKYELSGGSIANIVGWCTMTALHRNQDHIDKGLLKEGIRREFQKENKSI